MGKMTEAEARYGQNEKETLATTWACEQFSNDILTDTIGTVELLVNAFFCNTALLHCLGVAN